MFLLPMLFLYGHDFLHGFQLGSLLTNSTMLPVSWIFFSLHSLPPETEAGANYSRNITFMLQLEKLIAKNYFLNMSAKEAFKAYVRSYDSHHLKQIFDVHTLDLAKVALSFGFTVPPRVDLSEWLLFYRLLFEKNLPTKSR